MVLNTSCETILERFQVQAAQNDNLAEIYRETLERLLEIPIPSMKDVFHITRITLRFFSDDVKLWQQIT